ncbi:MAG: glycosyltransferase [Bryobacterales bacterium]|nr:glycosyltransferase [Bryobacterales bacterium]
MTARMNPAAVTASPGLFRLSGWRRARITGQPLDDCSLIVPTLRRHEDILALLTHLTKEPEPPGELVIVDGAGDGQLGLVLDRWAMDVSLPFDLVYVEGPRGLTLQRNVGIDVSHGQFVFFLDDDALPLEGYFRAIRTAFLTSPSIGGVCGSLVLPPSARLPYRWRLRFALRIVPRIRPFAYHPSGTSVPPILAPQAGTRPVDIMPGCAFALRREVFLQHRFSAFFTGYSYGEDVEMSLRVGKTWRLLCCGEALVIHRQAPTNRLHGFRKGRMEMLNRHFIWKRHVPHPGRINQFRFWADAALVVALDLLSARFAHSAGMIVAAGRCVFNEPTFEEGPAALEYELV